MQEHFLSWQVSTGSEAAFVTPGPAVVRSNHAPRAMEGCCAVRLLRPVVRRDAVGYRHPSYCLMCIATLRKANTPLLRYRLGGVRPGIADTYCHSAPVLTGQELQLQHL